MILDYNIQRICNKAETIPERKEERDNRLLLGSVGQWLGVCQLLGMSAEKYNLIMFSHGLGLQSCVSLFTLNVFVL